MMKTLKQLIYLPPFLAACYPVLYLLVHNNHEIPLLAGLRSLIIANVLAAALLMLSFLICKERVKAAWIASLGVAVFFTYGHFYNSIKGLYIYGIAIARHRLLTPLMLIVVTVTLIIIIRKKDDYEQVTANINFFGMFLIALPLMQLVYAQGNIYLTSRRTETNSAQQITATDIQTLPDIYYLILDGYPRGDVILDSLSYDNTPFLKWLERQGFYVAACSQSNYSYTKPAMASTFNMIYLGDKQNPNKITFEDDKLSAILQNSLVQQTLKEMDYSIITFETAYKWLKWDQPDYFYSIDDYSKQNYQLDTGLNKFELLILETTAASIILDQFNLHNLLAKDSRQIHQEQILFTLDKLMEIPEMGGPKFIYAHIVSPHPPYIFDHAGELLVNKPADELASYGDQIAYINNKLKEIIYAIIENSSTAPIIIVQGDHGAVIEYEDAGIDPLLKLAILNAYYLPGFDNNQLYASISPVNTFRIIFNHYFGTDYPMLEDLSIYGNQSPYQQLPCPTDQ